ncbi:MAG: hypothetical protein R3F04_00485 [Lysobacteraceae bacterium]
MKIEFNTLMLAAGLGILSLSAEAAIETQRLQPVPLATEAEFGFAITNQHPIWVVSAPGADQVHVFDCAGARCVSGQVLTGAGATGFGRALALDGDWLAIGQPIAQRVSLYQHQSGTWVLHSTIEPAVPALDGRFGASLSMDGTQLAVGAPGEQNGAGAVYVYAEGSGQWTQQVRFGASASLQRLGHAVVIDGTTLAVGAPFSAVAPGYAEGRVWVLAGAGSSWTEEALLTSPVPVSAELFGYALDLQTGRLVVGRPGAGQNAVNEGAVDVFSRSPEGSWSHDATLTALNGAANERLGWSVALEGQQILAGAPFALANQTFLCGSSTLFVFSANQWANADFSEHDRLPGSLTGFSVAVSAQRWMTGAPTFAESAGAGSGVGYWFNTVGGLFGHGFGLADVSCMPEVLRR